MTIIEKYKVLRDIKNSKYGIGVYTNVAYTRITLRTEKYDITVTTVGARSTSITARVLSRADKQRHCFKGLFAYRLLTALRNK